MKRSCSGILLMSVALWGVWGGPAAPPAPKKITTVEGITEYQLDNGLRLLLFPDKSRPRVVVNLTILTGSRHEGPGEGGMAHLLEHLLFKGTPTHKDIPRLLQERGAQYNGTTWLDRTNYFEVLPAKDDNLEWAIRFEADRMVNSHISRDDLASEMTVVRNEFEMGENSPELVLSQRMWAAAFEWHSYGKATIGNRSDIEKVPIEKLQAFYKKHYRPDNAVLIIAGDFDEAKALAHVARYFGPIPRPAGRLEKTYTEEPPPDGERTVTVRRVGEVGMVGVLYRVPAGPHPDFAAVQVLRQVLVAQPTGRLYKALVEGKKAESVGGQAFALHDPGVLELMVRVGKDRPLADARDAMLAVIDEVRRQGVTPAEVDRARKQILKERELAAANSAQIAIELSEWAAQGDWRLYFLSRDRIEKVTADDVKAAAVKYLHPNNRTVGTFVPTREAERVAIPATPDVAAMVKDYKGRAEPAAGEAFDVAPLKIESRTQRHVLPEGLQLALLAKKTRGQSVVLQLTLRFGDVKSLKGLTAANSLLPELMCRGTRKFDFTQLRDELDKHKTTLTAYAATAGQIVFHLQTTQENLPAALELLRQILREPRLDKEEFATLRRQRIASYEELLPDPEFQAMARLLQKLAPYPEGDVRRVDSPEKVIELLKACTWDDVKRLYDDFLGGENGELAVVGDFDPKTVRELASAAFAGWKAKQPYRRIAHETRDDIQPGKEIIKTPDKENAVFAAGLAWPIQDYDADHVALVIANEILGGESLSARLNERLRQKDGLSYGASSSYQADHRDRQAVLLIHAVVNPENLPRLEKGVREELERFVKDGITQEELDRARKGFLEEMRVQRTADEALASILADTLEKGRTMAYYDELEKKVNALKRDDVNRVVKKQIQPQRLVVVAAGDFDKKPPKR